MIAKVRELGRRGVRGRGRGVRCPVRAADGAAVSAAVLREPPPPAGPPPEIHRHAVIMDDRDNTFMHAVADWLEQAARLHEWGSTGPLDMPAALAVATRLPWADLVTTPDSTARALAEADAGHARAAGGSWVCGRCGEAPELHASPDSRCVYDPVLRTPHAGEGGLRAAVEALADECERLYVWMCHDDMDTDVPRNRAAWSVLRALLAVAPAGDDTARALEDVAAQLQAWAVDRFDKHGGLDQRGAALWDASVWLREERIPALAPEPPPP